MLNSNKLFKKTTAEYNKKVNYRFNIMFGLVVITIFFFLGELLIYLLALPIPGAVVGMLLLTLWFCCNRGVADYLADAARSLLRYMPLFFIPAAVGVINLKDILQTEGLAILALIVITTIITMLVSALSFQLIFNYMHRAKRGK